MRRNIGIAVWTAVVAFGWAFAGYAAAKQEERERRVDARLDTLEMGSRIGGQANSAAAERERHVTARLDKLEKSVWGWGQAHAAHQEDASIHRLPGWMPQPTDASELPKRPVRTSP